MRKQDRADGPPRDFFETLPDGKFLSEATITRVYVYGDITESLADTFHGDILLAVAKNRPILVHLNSFGGLVDAGFRMATILLEAAAHVPVSVLVDGIAGSAATFLTTAVPYVVCFANSVLLIHAVSWTQGRRTVTANQLRDEVGEAHQIHEAMLDLYTRKTTMSRDEVEELMGSDRLLTAQHGKKLGMVSRVLRIDPVRKKAPAWLAGYLECMSTRNAMHLVVSTVCNRRSDVSEVCIAIDREFFGGVLPSAGGDGAFTTLVSSPDTARPECVVFRLSALAPCGSGLDVVVPVGVRLGLVSARLPTIAVIDAPLDLPGLALVACCTRRVMYRSVGIALTDPEDVHRAGRNVSPFDMVANRGLTRDVYLAMAASLLPDGVAQDVRKGRSVFLSATEALALGAVDEVFE